ncbi:DENN domain-containing protein 1C isoform X4 [Hyalella azteca]|uniref:DENN domain-containing protein 1C isoform X4 n=1 Tax=Hyalella azteca TaxID=294128 RepID=A0A8B7NB01_HYAAZ|nr:DENN domain-containing protein 1C isoform X4 [Hyalella azteca]
MGSRIRSTPSTLLECWCEVVAGQGPDQPPWIIQKFPSTYDDHSTLNSVPQFVFPCKIETNVVQNFSFVLTALDSKFTFGFCRHSPNAQSAIVILSFLPWDSTFYKIMNLCSELQSSENPEDVWSFLKALYNTPVPEPGSDLAFSYPPANKMFVAKCPDHLSLPSLPDNRNLLEYINAVSTETMMVVFASLLFERRILISSRHLHRVSACVQAANALLYPMTWQHIYIPIMPELLLDYLLAPIPFLIGVPDVLMKKVSLDEVGDVVYLNADTNVIRTPFNDLAELPNEVCSQLRRRLSQPGQGMGDSVPRAFLRALVMLIGNYRDALQFNEEDRKVFFNADKFVASRPQHLQVFVTKMLELQIFSQFIEERLDLVNKGEAKSDEFEMEVSVHSDRPRKNYQHLVHAVKKEGGAIVKNFKSKTNPAVKSAVKSVSKSSKQVRERGAEKYKEIKGKMKLPAGRSPEHIVWSAPDLPEHSPPPSPPSRLPTNRPNMEVTSKVTYKRPLPNNRAPSDQDGVPSSRSSSSFRSPDSPGHTPAPHSIDLVGELEQELLCRLSEPSALSSRPSLSTPFSSSTSTTNTTSTTGGQPAILNGSRRRSVTRPTVLPPPIPTVIPPPVPAARAHTTLGSTRGHDKESPTSQGLVVTKATSASLTSLISIDVSLDIELPPPITCQILPIASQTLPHKHRLNQDHELTNSEERERFHRHYYRSPKQLGGGQLQYNTLPRSLCSSDSPTNGKAQRSAFGTSQNTGSNTTGRVYNSLGITARSSADASQPTVPRDRDVVSLYGTADDFKTRMLYPKHVQDSSSFTRKTGCQRTLVNQTNAAKTDDILLPEVLKRHENLTSSNTVGSNIAMSAEQKINRVGVSGPSNAGTEIGITKAPNSEQDRDLILLGSPLEEEFDPLMSKSVAPPVPSTAPPPDLNLLPPPRPPPRPDAPHPVPSFLHSLPTASRLLEASSSSSSSSSVYQPYVPFSSSLHDIKSPTVELLSPTSTTSSSLPDFSCTSSASPSSVCTATATDTLSTCRGTSDQPLGIPPPTPLPLLPSPARRPSSGSLGGQQRSGHHIPSQTMASLPAALQNHLANQLNRTPQKNNSSSPLPPAAPVGSSSKNLSAFDDPRFVPFHTRFQSTSTAPPTAQANPLYNAHDLATSIQTSGARDASTVSELNSQSMSANSNVGKPNFAAAFASTMIKTGDQLAANNNNVIEPKMLGSFSESFAQMKLNKSLVAEPVTSSTSTQSTKQQKPPWTSFE